MSVEINELENLTILQKRILRVLSCGAQTSTVIREKVRLESIAATQNELSILVEKKIIEKLPDGRPGSYIYFIPNSENLWSWILKNI
jgi:hypothetical protein